jgi:uncharacterized protein YaiI (UPF0178 family)
MAIYVDADACPVKDETVTVANRHKLDVYIVSNGGIRPHPHPHPQVHMIIVSEGADEADKWIADQAKAGDIVITADIPLAAGAAVLRHDGNMITEANIGNQLATRDLMSDIRAADPLFTGQGHKSQRSFSKQDRSRFLNNLEMTIRKVTDG